MVVEGELISEIKKGFVVLLGVKVGDTEEEIDYLVKKISQLRVFEDDEGKMNRDIQQVDGAILSISQFTLLANTRKGNRPSFIEAESPEQAQKFYELFNQKLLDKGIQVSTGIFGADMKVSLVNDGPVTIIFDTEHK